MLDNDLVNYCIKCIKVERYLIDKIASSNKKDSSYYDNLFTVKSVFDDMEGVLENRRDENDKSNRQKTFESKKRSSV